MINKRKLKLLVNITLIIVLSISCCACGKKTINKDNSNNTTVSTQDSQGNYYTYFKVTESKLADGTTKVRFDVDYEHYTVRQARENVSGVIVIPDGVTEICSFQDYDKVTKVVIPKTVTELPRNCFYGCDNLEEVVLPDTMTTLNGYSFADCPKIESITMPKSLKALVDGSDVFISGVKSIYFPADVQLEVYNHKSVAGVLFTSMPVGIDKTVYVVKDSWMDIHFEELYQDESSDSISPVTGEVYSHRQMPTKAYWDGINK